MTTHASWGWTALSGELGGQDGGSRHHPGLGASGYRDPSPQSLLCLAQLSHRVAEWLNERFTQQRDRVRVMMPSDVSRCLGTPTSTFRAEGLCG